MLAGFAPEDFKIRPTKAESSGSEKSGETTTTRWKLNLLNWFSGARFRIGVVFPYKHNQSDWNAGNFTVQTIARLAVVPSSCTSLRSEKLHEALRPKDKSDWESSEAAGTLKGTKGVFCVSFKVKQTLEVPANIVNDEQTGKSIELQFEPPSGLSASMEFLERKQTEGKDGQAGMTTYTAHLVPLGTDGKPVVTPETEITSDEYASKLVGESYTPMLFIWTRIVDSEGQTVDLVPAVLEDDQDLNGINSQTPQLAYCGTRRDGPLMRFVPEGVTFNWQDLTEGGGGLDGADKIWNPQAFATLDPHFNWAPEDWYGCTNSVVTTFSNWLDSVHDYLSVQCLAGDRNINTNVLTVTSDLGRLESIAEFANLLRVTDDQGNVLLPSLGDNGFDGRLRTTKEEVASISCAWRSYRVDREFYDAMEARGIIYASVGMPGWNETIGYFPTGLSGWTNGESFVGLTMRNRDDLPGSDKMPEGVVAMITPETSFTTNETIDVSFAMPTNATMVRYTLDGSEPTAESAVYAGPFAVTNRSVIVKAIACADDWFSGASTSWTLARAPWTAAECLNVETRCFAADGDAAWFRDLETTHDGVAAWRSGVIGNKQDTVLQMTVTGSGTVSFWCRVSSECDEVDGEVYDGLTVEIDGRDALGGMLGGEIGWTNICIDVTGSGEHVVSWRYEKDRTGSAGEDGAWLDEILWQADEVVVPARETGSKDIVISRNWIEQELVTRYGSDRTAMFRQLFGTDYEQAVRKFTGKTFGGKPGVIWQDYVAGTDPTDTNSVFAASIQLVNGLPDVTWLPDLGKARTYTVWGRKEFNDTDGWTCPTNSFHRFFKVTVDMP